MKDYNTKMALNIGDDEVKMVTMGNYSILIDGKKHLLTYGLGPCVGLAIVIKEKDGSIIRFLSHIDMGQIIEITFNQLQDILIQLKKIIANQIQDIKISLISTQSYTNMSCLNEKETKLLSILLREFEQFGIKLENIKFDYSSQVQISPSGNISVYTEEELNEHKKNMLQDDLNSFGGYIHPDLNIYITNYGAYMGNCSLSINSNEEEKQKELSKNYWQDFISKDYKLVIEPSFNNPDCLAIYVSNWNDLNIQKYGTIPGCLQVNTNKSKKFF